MIKETLKLRAFGLLKIPMLLYVRPKVEILNDQRVEISIPLNYFTKNHLNSLYFGVLCAGADVASGILALNLSEKANIKLSLAFKAMNAKFHKRAHARTHFYTEDVPKITEFFNKVKDSDERHNEWFKIKAVCPSIDPHDVVAEFDMELSLKKK